MKTWRMAVGLAVAGMLWMGAGPAPARKARAEEPAKAAAPAAGGSEKDKAKIKLAWDFGDRKLDVSKYPAEIQAAYKDFENQCTKCHDLTRPLNAPYATREEWQRYVKRMMSKPGCEMTMEKAKRIHKFLTHDSQVRKLMPDGQTATKEWLAYLEELKARYKKATGREWKSTAAALAGQ